MSQLLMPLIQILDRHQQNPDRFLQVMDGTFGHSTKNMSFILKAHCDADDAHRGRNRDDGQPYIRHPEAAAIINVAYLGRSDVTEVIAELLHDVPEDHPETWRIIRASYSTRVVDAVNGCNRHRFDYLNDKWAIDREFHHQLLFCEAPTTGVVKLAEHLHNLLTATPDRLTDDDWIRRKLANLHAYYIPLARRLQVLYREMLAVAEMLERRQRLLPLPPRQD